MNPPDVAFYLLNRDIPDGKLRVACRLTRKALAQGFTVYARVTDADQAMRLDALMWTFDPGSFVPHRLARDTSDPAPAIIGHDPAGEEPAEVLISLSVATGSETPENFQNHQRIAELVGDGDQEKRLARARYKAYKDHGCALETHHIDP